MDYDCPLPAPGYLDEGAAGLVHDCPRVGGQRPAEEGGAQVHRHRGEPKHTIIQSVINPEKNGKETPILGVAQFGELSYPGS